MKTSELNKIALILTLIAIILILVYGIDAILDTTEEGFLPFDEKIRGYVLGLPSVILPLIAFGVMWKLPSSKLGILLLIDGVIILIGSIAFASFQETSTTVEYSVILENYYSLAHVIALGSLIFNKRTLQM